MIERITKEKDLLSLMTFFETFFDYDFYINDNNIRVYISDYKSIHRLFKQTHSLYGSINKGVCNGAIGVWKIKKIDKVEYQLKIAASSYDIAEKLLTIVLWNVYKDLYIKVRKDNKYINLFKKKGFRFQDSRGSQIILFRKYIPVRKINERDINHSSTVNPVSVRRTE